MHEPAFLLTSDPFSIDDQRAGSLLDFFGVSYETRKATEFQLPESTRPQSNTKCRLVCAGETFARLKDDLQNIPGGREAFAQRVHSVFLYPANNLAKLATVVSELSGVETLIGKSAQRAAEWRIADDSEGFGGAMRGILIRPTSAAQKDCDLFDVNGSAVAPLISTGTKAAFLRLIWQTVPVFVSSARLIDIGADLATPNFDIRDHLFTAVPAVSYIRWAFARTSWNTPAASACLVIDDPLLRMRYGFLRFRELLALMKQLRFSTSIAFIPWNWRRSDPKVVQLFKDNPDNYSLCIHGCDHTAGEFGISNQQQLRAISSEAARRMSLHEQRTGLTHDRVMVFPQGIFSERAILELKHANFSAVVNTEVHSNLLRGRKLRISDVWDVAVMRYGDFPVYTRRYPSQGIENLAFDLLLGKPCLVVIHHDFCSNGYARLAQFIEELNALNVSLVWRRLGEVVRRGYRQRELSSESMEIEMYGSELLIENRSGRAMSYFVRRREREPSNIESLYAGSCRVLWSFAGDYVEFKVDLAPGESTLLRLLFKAAEDVAYEHHNLAHSAKTGLRRYLSEARDNYLMLAKARMAAFSRS